MPDFAERRLLSICSNLAQTPVTDGSKPTFTRVGDCERLALSSVTAVIHIEGPYGRLAVDDRGSGGTPAMFVHGNGGSSKVWGNQLAFLAPARRVVGIDLHGFGRSRPAAGDLFSLEAFVDDLEVATPRLEIATLVLVGHSLAGAVISLFAHRHPDRVAGLVFVDSVGDKKVPAPETARLMADLESAAFRDFTARWFGRLLTGARDETRSLVLDELENTPRSSFVGAFCGMDAADIPRWLSTFSGPCLHIFVPEFHTTPGSLQDLVPDMPTAAMTGVSHWPMLDRPDEFNAHLERFLERV